VLRVLFEEVCFGLSLSGFFNSHDAPSLFVIYAHDNFTLGRADSGVVRELISHLNVIGAKCRSDRGPTLRSDAPGHRARHDILENQFCILPESVSDTSVDKIVLFHSEALQTCCTSKEGRKYVKGLRTVGLHESKKSGYGVHDESNMLSEMARSTQGKIRAEVESHIRQPWFHHVLTEIGLLGLRTAWERNPYMVVAVNLHGIETISDDLKFLGHTQHYLNVPPLDPVLTNEAVRYHQLFFVLLERVYKQLPKIVYLIRQHYRAGLASLKEGRRESLVGFRKAIRFEITEDIERFGTYHPTQNKTFMDHSGKESPPLHRSLPNKSRKCTA
jgi:hypothetical protein